MPVLKPEDAKLISKLDKSLDKTVTIDLNLFGHPADQSFSNLVAELKSLVSNLSVNARETDHELPGFLIRENIFYSALPLEKELEPFLETLSFLGGASPELPDHIQDKLKDIDIPVNLKLYIALHCPHCPLMVKTVVPLAFMCDQIKLEIIDGSLFTEEAQKDRVMSAPCLILDNDFRWTGSVTPEEIVKMITDRDPSSLSSSTLRTILEQGEAEWISREMIKAGKIFDSFIRLLLHETWSVRLGAMVVVETLAQESPELSDKLCPVLIENFDSREIPVQGDILYALGEAGNQDTLEWIKSKESQISHPDLKEAASEAMETLEENLQLR